MKKSIYKNLFQALPCSWKFINNAKCYSQRYRGGVDFRGQGGQSTGGAVYRTLAEMLL